MRIHRVPPALQERLGRDASAGLLELLADVRKEWMADVTGIVGDRFERRLVEEISKLRVEMAQGFAAVRQEMAQGLSAVRQEMTQGFAEQRVELLKWAFLFWIGQFFAVASLVAVVVRYLHPGG